CASRSSCRRASPPGSSSGRSNDPQGGAARCGYAARAEEETLNRLVVTSLVVLAVAAVLLAWPPADEALPVPEPALEPAESSAPAAAEAATVPTSDGDAAPRAESTPAPWLADLVGGEAEDEAEAPPSGTISGRVAWRAGGLPVEGARVRLQRAPRDTVIPEPGEEAVAAADDPSTTTTTDNHGKFTLGW